MECKYCKNTCYKAGKQYDGTQKYKCLKCKKYQQRKYRYKACGFNLDEEISRHLKRGCGIRDMGILLQVSFTTVISHIRKIGCELESPYKGKAEKCEMDELHTYVGHKKNEKWITYAIERGSKQMIELRVGKRNSEDIGAVVKRVLSFSPEKIFTDRLNVYPSLIDKSIHVAGRRITNRIERMNLNLRTHLKRLNRQSICYSKQTDMLEACLRIYFWG